MDLSKLLAVLAILFWNGAFFTAIVYSRYEPRWIVSYVAVVLLYSTLYFSRLRRLPEELRRRLWKAAVTLVLFLTGLFFYNFAPGMTWWVAGVSWLGLAAAAYFAYDVMFEGGVGSELQRLNV